MKIDLEMERKLQNKFEYFCKYKCDQQEMEDNIFNMLSGDIDDAWLDGNLCDICKLKSFIREIRDELI